MAEEVKPEEAKAVEERAMTVFRDERQEDWGAIILSIILIILMLVVLYAMGLDPFKIGKVANPLQFVK
ncbi:MAG: hypothetical protein HY929_05315 [Euryarchaeota archaeon]|nr:hypothetical protein [Euryarchaeota archaeon]